MELIPNRDLPLLLLTLDSKPVAQSTDKSDEKEKGYTFYEQFQGSSNTLGQVMKFDTSVGYDFNKFFGVEGGVPFYIVRPSTTTTSTTTTTTPKSANGIGDAYADLRLTVNNPAWSARRGASASFLVLTLPIFESIETA